MKDCDKLPEKKQQNSEDHDSGDNSEYDGKNWNGRWAVLVSSDPNSGVICGLVVVIEVVEGAVIGWIHKLTRSRIVESLKRKMIIDD